MGIGGGFLLTIYNKMNGTAEVLNARESAPLAATKDMFGKPGDTGIQFIHLCYKQKITVNLNNLQTSKLVDYLLPYRAN